MHDCRARLDMKSNTVAARLVLRPSIPGISILEDIGWRSLCSATAQESVY